MGAPLSVPRRLLSIDEYHQMANAGILGEGDRVELIEGELIQMAPISGAHIQPLNFLNRALVLQVGEDGVVSPQNPIALHPDSEPEPDLVVLRPECLRRADVPVARDVLLVVEIAVTSIDYDRDTKIPLYAKHGIPECWLVEPTRRNVTAYRNPIGGRYLELLTFGPPDVLTTLLLPNVKVRLADLWP